MTDQELRQMVRDSIARAGVAADVAQGISPAARAAQGAGQGFSPAIISSAFAKFPLLRSGDDDGACVIEPAVRCNHCGYCLSFGH